MPLTLHKQAPAKREGRTNHTFILGYRPSKNGVSLLLQTYENPPINLATPPMVFVAGESVAKTREGQIMASPEQIERFLSAAHPLLTDEQRAALAEKDKTEQLALAVNALTDRALGMLREQTRPQMRISAIKALASELAHSIAAKDAPWPRPYAASQIRRIAQEGFALTVSEEEVEQMLATWRKSFGPQERAMVPEHQAAGEHAPPKPKAAPPTLSEVEAKRQGAKPDKRRASKERAPATVNGLDLEGLRSKWGAK